MKNAETVSRFDQRGKQDENREVRKKDFDERQDDKRKMKEDKKKH